MVTNCYDKPNPEVRTIRVGDRSISQEYKARATTEATMLRSPREGVDVATADRDDTMLLPAVWVAEYSDAIQVTADKYLCLLSDAMGNEGLLEQTMKLINNWCKEVGIN